VDLVLFTSYDQLKRTSRAISPILANDDILVYEQGEGASAHTLLENFRLSDRAVLLGTRAFWEGVDIPGESLSVLVIAKLPFAVPSDPIVAARAETFEDPFYQYSLPDAILRFRQGFGRLIRSQSDRGLVAVFDRRVLTKKLPFLTSPKCTTARDRWQSCQSSCEWLNQIRCDRIRSRLRSHNFCVRNVDVREHDSRRRPIFHVHFTPCAFIYCRPKKPALHARPSTGSPEIRQQPPAVFTVIWDGAGSGCSHSRAAHRISQSNPRVPFHARHKRARRAYSLD
jgi:hypothetical protein